MLVACITHDLGAVLREITNICSHSRRTSPGKARIRARRPYTLPTNIYPHPYPPLGVPLAA
jgi:hypothetical protein